MAAGCPVANFYIAIDDLNSGLPRTDPDSGREEDLGQGPPDFKSSELSHSVMPPPLIACIFACLLVCSLVRSLSSILSEI